LTIKPKDKNF
jgi:hypothetical protein